MAFGFNLMAFDAPFVLSVLPGRHPLWPPQPQRDSLRQRQAPGPTNKRCANRSAAANQAPANPCAAPPNPSAARQAKSRRAALAPQPLHSRPAPLPHALSPRPPFRRGPRHVVAGLNVAGNYPPAHGGGSSRQRRLSLSETDRRCR